MITFKDVFIIFRGFLHQFQDFPSSRCGERSNLRDKSDKKYLTCRKSVVHFVNVFKGGHALINALYCSGSSDFLTLFW